MISYPLIKFTDSIGGLTLTLPAEGRAVTPGEVDQDRNGRVSSGKLVTDTLKEKKAFSISYSLLDGDVLESLLELKSSNNDLVMQYQKFYTGPVQVYYVRIVAPIKRTRLLATGHGQYTDVSIEIEEV